MNCSKMISIPVEGPLYLDLLFSKKQPLVIEYCSGNGQWIVDRALQNPFQNWIAVEWDRSRAHKIDRRQARYQLENLLVVHGEALLFSRMYLQDHSVSAIYINFPDPWPKRRHAKHRLIQQPFVQELERILISQAPVMIVTDDATYSEQIVNQFEKWPSAFSPEKYVTEWPEYGDSFFRSLWQGKACTIRYHRFINNRGRGI